MTTWVAIANAQAGSSDAAAIEAAVARLRESHEVRLFETRDRDDLEDALAAARDGDGVAIVLGGDGSLHAVVTVLDDLGLADEVALALVPMGTGNDFARTIGMSSDPAAAAGQLLAARARPVDLIRDDEGRVVVNAAHVGVGAEASVAAKPWKKAFGRIGYAVGAIVSGATTEGIEATVTVDGHRVPSRGRILQVAIGNGRFLGGGAEALPGADPSDGLLDVAISWADSRASRVGYAWLMRRGRHPQRDDVAYLQGRHVEVTGEPSLGNVDGEVCEAAPTHTWQIEPAAFRMLLPVGSGT